MLICSNTAWSLVNFRAGLIRAMLSLGYEVVAAAPADGHEGRLARLGCRFVELPMVSASKAVYPDLLLLGRFLRLFRRERPDVFLGYTIKPNVFGSLAARMAGVPAINNIAGLGAAFNARSRLARIAGALYRVSLAGSMRVFLQNEDDQRYFLRTRIIRSGLSEVLPGSGVDITAFAARPGRVPDGETRFLLLGRMLWDKGVGEFVQAARQVRKTRPDARFQMLGFLGVPSPKAVLRRQVEEWSAEGVIDYLGQADDVRAAIAAADCVVLPSYYREGVPRSLLEAAAMGKPLITTDWPGCRETVADGANGFLCRPRDADDLAAGMLRFLMLSSDDRRRMGEASRTMAETKFDEQIVIGRYLELLRIIKERRTVPSG